MSAEEIAAGILLAALIIYMARVGIALFQRGHHVVAILVFAPFGLWGIGLIAAALGFGTL